MNDYLPTKRAWIAVSVLGLCVAAIVWFVTQSDLSLKVTGAYDVQLKVGDGATEVNVINIVRPEKPGA